MSHQNPTLQRTSLPRSFIDSNKESTTPEPSVSSTTSSNFRKAQVSKTPKSNVIHKCPNHPEEDLQFYCFNNRTLLCGECLVKGGYADFEVTSVKKASEKVKEKLTELAKLATTKLEDFYLIEKEMEGHEAQIEKTIFNYKGEIKEKMDTLRKIIDLKEQEAIEKVNRAQQEKLASIKEVLSSFQGLKEEVESVKLMQEHRNEELTDFEICEYYSTREKVLKESLGEDMTMKIEKAKKLIETQQSQAQICFSKFEDEFKKVQEYIKNFNVDLGIQRKSSPSFTTPREEKETTAAKIERLSKFTSYYAQEESREKRQAQKESVKPQSQSPRQPAGQQTFSFLNMKAAHDESPAVKTPIGKQGTPRSTFLSDKREIVLNKEGSQKNLYQKSSIPAMLNSYKEMLSSKGGSVESVTPKTTAREVVSVSAINSYRSEMPSNKGLLDSFFVMGPQKTVKVEKRVMETSIDQISLCRTAPDFQGSLRDQVSSTSKLLSRNEGLGSFDFDNPFSKKGQNDVESLLSNENKLKQKLKKLNSQMFKY